MLPQMAAKVEANSLSEISQTAANPPKYPRNPTEQQRKPLTLYISRVPGSRDIILTTLKPRLKNVTAEDVSNCLYYLHLNTEDDARFLKEDDAVMSDTSRSNSLNHPPVPRKALPESARLSFNKDGDGQTRRQGSEPDLTPRTLVQDSEDTPFTGKALMEDLSQGPLAMKNSIRRKPLGPRSLVPEQTNSLHEKAASLTDPKPSAYTMSALREPDTQTPSTLGLKTSTVEAIDTTRPATFVISMIRRDPAAETQMNIGTITGNPESFEVVASARIPRSKPRKMYPIISIHLTTPGYNQFRLPQVTRHIDTPKSNLRISLEEHGTQYPNYGLGFQRELRMEGSGFWSRQTKLHKRALSYDLERDSNSIARSLGSPSVEASSDLSPQHIADSNESEPRGYVFNSPWGGRCKFSTGGGGRSLRCRHKLPVPAFASNTTDSDSLAPAVVISELRFNLPSLSLFNPSTTSDSPPKPRAEISEVLSKAFGHIPGKISSLRADQRLPPLPPRPQPTWNTAAYPSDEEIAPPLPPRSQPTALVTESSSGDEVEDHSQDELNSAHFHLGSRLDLRLGQEKAGGGNRGKRAKLGKLIIHDEGIKMLDLIVAANMGIWWTVWESEHR